MVWNIYGKQYDLTKFIDIHPGGKNILLSTENEKDLTPLFETYHAFSNKEKIMKILDKYEILQSENVHVDTIQSSSNYNQYDFINYNKLLNEIKKIFPTRNSIKSSIFFVLENIIIFIFYCFAFYNAMFSNYSIPIKCLFSFLAGLLYISLGFNIMHDGSHYAITIYPSINNLLNKLLNSWGLWNANIWFYHHILNHHSFTGEENKDPDLYHLNPFLNKLITLKKSLLHNKSCLYVFLLLFIPGQYVGQIISYLLTNFKYKIFKIKVPNKKYYDFVDIFIIISKLFCLYNGLFLPTVIYFISLNLWYHINIIFDHDTYESAITNHYDQNDWLKMQICNSGNFLNENIIWTRLFGGINYQIEHHLFPNMSNIHYPTIAPIVKKFCEENNIPYQNHKTLNSGYESFSKMLKFYNSDKI